METHWLLLYQKPNWLQHKELHLNQVTKCWLLEWFCFTPHGRFLYGESSCPNGLNINRFNLKATVLPTVSTRRPPRWMMKPCMFARKHRLQLAENHLTIFFHGIFLFLLHHFRWFGDFKSMKFPKTTCFLTMAQNFWHRFSWSELVMCSTYWWFPFGSSYFVWTIIWLCDLSYLYLGKKLPARFWGTCFVFFKSKVPLPFGASVATIWLHGVIPKAALRAHRFVNSCSRLGFWDQCFNLEEVSV